MCNGRSIMETPCMAFNSQVINYVTPTKIILTYTMCFPGGREVSWWNCVSHALKQLEVDRV